MNKVTDRAAYLRVLADGLEIDGSTKEGKLLLAFVEAFDEMAESLQKVSDANDETRSYVEEIDEALDALESELFEDDEECECHHHHDEDDEDYEDDEDGDDGLIEYDCPNCGTAIYFDETAFDLEEDHRCPNCGEPVFGEVTPDISSWEDAEDGREPEDGDPEDK